MTNVEINRAIAECMGYKWYWLEDDVQGHLTRRSLCYPLTARYTPLKECDNLKATIWQIHELPNYYEDLNEMHKAEKTLAKNEQPLYFRNLCPDEMEWLDHNAWPVLCFATSNQRAEAFLRAKGLWKD